MTECNSPVGSKNLLLLIGCRLFVIIGLGLPPMSHPGLNKFGLRVRALRESARLSQEQLADKARIHRTYIGGIERGERNVGLKNILRIAVALGVAPSQLFVDFQATNEHKSLRRGSK